MFSPQSHTLTNYLLSELRIETVPNVAVASHLTSLRSAVQCHC